MYRLLLAFFLTLAPVDVNCINDQQCDDNETQLSDSYCEHCKKAINDEIDLQFHLENSHNLCTICNNQFSSPKSVRKHFTIAHADDVLIKKQ